MKIPRYYIFSLLLLVGILGIRCKNRQEAPTDAQLRQHARQLAGKYLLIDTHIDVPYRLWHKPADISQRTAEGHFDYPRAVSGGLNAAFMSIYIPASYYETSGGANLADSLIDLVESFPGKWPEKFSLAYTVKDVRQNFAAGRFSLPMGMENGTGLDGKLENLKHFYQRGIRYITLSHARNNRICDSSYDTGPKWNGLSPFGKKVVAEMNRLGMMIDVSHVTDSTFYQVIRLSRAPVIASHSSCRFFTPGFQRNMSDDMIRLLAQKGGVIQINFGSYFVNKEYQQQAERYRKEIQNYLHEHHLASSDSAADAFRKKYRAEHPLPRGTVSDVADHIDHVVNLVGAEYVGFGSDFDGVRSLPVGLEDVSMYPNLIYQLLKRGYSDNDIRKICGENLLRVWSEVEKVAAELQNAG